MRSSTSSVTLSKYEYHCIVLYQKLIHFSLTRSNPTRQLPDQPMQPLKSENSPSPPNPSRPSLHSTHWNVCYYIKKLSHSRNSVRCRRCWFYDVQGHSRSSAVVSGDAIWLPITLNSDLTSLLNRSWDIMPNLHTHTPSLFQVELERDGWE